jgi:hypothetical protein
MCSGCPKFEEIFLKSLVLWLKSNTIIQQPTQRKPMDYTTEQCVSRYVELRDEITNIQDKAKADVAALEELQTLISDELFTRLKASGGTSINTGAGSVVAKSTTSFIATDMGEVLRYIRETGKPELLQARLSSSACREFADYNGGMLPPGIGTKTTHSITIRRA